MLVYILRRLAAALLILFAATFLVFVLVTYAGDPLKEFRESADPSAKALMAAREKALHLDIPLIPRYFMWLRGAVGCLNPLGNTCDLGHTFSGQLVTEALGNAIVQTLILITAATILSILIGIALGVVAALRQNSTVDYGITFIAFLSFSLPSFWIAVLLKEFGAIGFNNFLQDPTLSVVTIVVVGVVAGVIWYLASYGRRGTRLLFGGIGFVLTVLVLFGVSATRWLARPSLGIPLILVLGVATALLLTSLVSGLRNRRALWSGLVVVAIGLGVYFPIQAVLGQATWWLIIGLGILALVIGAVVGWLFGGYDRGQNIKVSMMTALVISLLVFADRMMQSWPAYVANGRISGRPIATANSATPGLSGDLWITGIDRFTHLVLPTIALTLLALASYSRYSRASMLEIMSQDYIRTARAKGVSERSVVVKHAFRNALIPLATLIAFDIGGIIGGAVVTESVFGFSGMGNLFVKSLGGLDIYPIMGFFLVTGLTAMVFNLVADLVYSVLDPRVRVKA